MLNMTSMNFLIQIFPKPPREYLIKYIMGRMMSSHHQSFFYLIESFWESFHSEELAGNLRKLDTNDSGILDCFAFERWYVD